MFRFLHTADIHLDSPLHGLAGAAQATAGQAGQACLATREALRSIVDLALREAVAFVVIAGDLYDSDWRDVGTGLFFVEQMGRLAEAGIAVALAHGNHDAEGRLTRSLPLPPTVHVFPGRAPASVTLPPPGPGEPPIVLHGQSYRDRVVTDNLALGYPPPVAGAFNIGVLHTGLGGRGGHANYAPCSVADLVGRGYDYWALGHVHQAEVVERHPPIVFPGTPQGRHIRETGPKGVTLVEVEDGVVTGLETVAVDRVRWALLEVSVESCRDRPEVMDRLRDALGAAVDTQADGRLLVCRVVLDGATALHAALVAAVASLTEEARAEALSLGDGRAWVERVIVATRPPEAPPPAPGLDALADFLAQLDAAAADEAFVETLMDTLEEMRRRQPPELAAALPDDPLIAADPGLRALVARDAPALIAHLRAVLAATLAPEEPR